MRKPLGSDQKERPENTHCLDIGGYRRVRNEHSRLVQVVCGERDGGEGSVLSALVLVAVLGGGGSGKDYLTFQRYVLCGLRCKKTNKNKNSRQAH